MSGRRIDFNTVEQLLLNPAASIIRNAPEVVVLTPPPSPVESPKRLEATVDVERDIVGELDRAHIQSQEHEGRVTISMYGKKMMVPHTNACCVWDFTAWIGGEHMNQRILDGYLEENCKAWCYQLEECPTTKRRHFQGRFSLKVKLRLAGVITKFPTPDGSIHFSVTSNENKKNNFYVMKSDSRIEGPWTEEGLIIDGRIMTEHMMEIMQLTPYPFQTRIEEISMIKDPRGINIVYDDTGNLGKSTALDRMRIKGIAEEIFFSGSSKDIMREICNIYQDPKNKRLKAIVVDMARPALDGLTPREKSQFWTALEQIKRGRAVDDRYRRKVVDFNPPVIWVFTNQKPEKRTFSADRWRVWTIDPVTKELVNRTKDSTVYLEYDMEQMQQQPQQARLKILTPQQEYMALQKPQRYI